ncbi:uncharacterized protein LY89DRAFT_736697 [Mollisia scopiformis]|uniref:Uncharacterized protein n=1 Tax=Mollisia scopiformis TaxID=149040 RepID=A0A194X0G6_MOLSC|nr:uncharacterized protein LY89DRAFT_736697 [Mollisia scopiformis]KUJ13693.1 hypothetical protein LY89DRAFT_736697 [Mollisia scopiformis]
MENASESARKRTAESACLDERDDPQKRFGLPSMVSQPLTYEQLQTELAGLRVELNLSREHVATENEKFNQANISRDEVQKKHDHLSSEYQKLEKNFALAEGARSELEENWRKLNKHVRVDQIKYKELFDHYTKKKQEWKSGQGEQAKYRELLDHYTKKKREWEEKLAKKNRELTLSAERKSRDDNASLLMKVMALEKDLENEKKNNAQYTAIAHGMSDLDDQRRKIRDDAHQLTRREMTLSVRENKLNVMKGQFAVDLNKAKESIIAKKKQVNAEKEDAMNEIRVLKWERDQARRERDVAIKMAQTNMVVESSTTDEGAVNSQLNLQVGMEGLERLNI